MGYPQFDSEVKDKPQAHMRATTDAKAETHQQPGRSRVEVRAALRQNIERKQIARRKEETNRFVESLRPGSSTPTRSTRPGPSYIGAPAGNTPPPPGFAVDNENGVFAPVLKGNAQQLAVSRTDSHYQSRTLMPHSGGRWVCNDRNSRQRVT